MYFNQVDDEKCLVSAKYIKGLVNTNYSVFT